MQRLAAVPRERSLSGRTIYVVDDDDGVRAALDFLLVAEGYDCRTYASGREFLRDLPTLRPGCVLLDVRMPQMNGLELLEQLKASRPDWPTVMITGHGDAEVASEAQRLGALDLLEKPFDARLMMDLLERAFAALPADG